MTGRSPSSKPTAVFASAGSKAVIRALADRPTRKTRDHPSKLKLIVPTQDTFSVYAGGAGATTNLSERPAVWRYEAKEALHSPNVPAVDEFRKAVEDAEKQQKSKP